MKITLIILEGNNRLKLGGKKRITYSPKRDFQLIIGTNGGGKSTLHQELSLLPPDGKDYERGGFKEVHAEHKGNYYIARSTFDGTPKHEFFKNGENLNKGFTLTVQRELVKNEIGLTPELHELLTGQLRFTTMNAQQRRWWITKFCSTDLTYANQMYQKAKQKLSHVNGALKHANSRIAQESNRLLELNDIEDIDKQVRVIRETLDYLLKKSNGKDINTDNALLTVEKTIQRIDALSRNILRNKMDKPSVLEGIYTQQGAIDRKQSLENDLAAAKASLKAYTDEYSQYTALRDMVSTDNPESIEFIEKKIQSVTTQLQAILHHSQYCKREGDVSKLLQHTLDCRNSIQNIILSVNSIEHFMTPKEADDLLQQITDEKQVCKNIEYRLQQLLDHRDHIHQVDEQECPKCQYVWKPGVSENELMSVEQRIEKGRRAQHDADLSLKKLLAREESAVTVKRVHQQFQRIIDQFEYIDPIIQGIRWVDMHNCSGEVLSSIDNIALSIQLSLDEASLLRQLDSYQAAVQHAMLLQQAQSVQQQQRYTQLESMIHSTTDTLHGIKNDIHDIHVFLQHVDQEQSQVNTLHEMYEEVSNGIKDYVVGNIENAIQHDITLQQGALGQLQRKLNEKNMVENIIKSLQSDKEQLMLVETATKRLIKELSPTEGLIAEQLYGSIVQIVDGVNKIISRIWTYALVVKPCATENDDLDYKFPLMVEQPEVIRSDISKGSSSMKDIVDYAFVELAYEFLGLEQYPLFLDEFGNRFDPEHLNRAMNYIQNKAEIGEYSQIFMISHFENYYGGFPSSDITLLHDGNVKFSAEHNQCIEIS